MTNKNTQNNGSAQVDNEATAVTDQPTGTGAKTCSICGTVKTGKNARRGGPCEDCRAAQSAADKAKGVAAQAPAEPATEADAGRGEVEDALWAAFEKAAKTWRAIEGRMAQDMELAELLLQPASQAEACFDLAEDGRLKKATFELWMAIELANSIEFKERGLPAITYVQQMLGEAHEKWDSLSGAVRAKLEEAETPLAEALDESKKTFVRAKAARAARGIVRSAFRLHMTEKEERDRAKNRNRVQALRGQDKQRPGNGRTAADAVQAEIQRRTLAGHGDGDEKVVYEGHLMREAGDKPAKGNVRGDRRTKRNADREGRNAAGGGKKARARQMAEGAI